MLTWRVRRLVKPVNVVVCLSMLMGFVSACAPQERRQPYVPAEIPPTPAVQERQESTPQPVPTPTPVAPVEAQPGPAADPAGGQTVPVRFDVALPPRPPGLASLRPLPGQSAPQIVMEGGRVAGISMEPGWHLISIPREPVDPNPAAVLSSIAGSYTRVYAYQACDLADPWKLYDPADPEASDLTAIDPSMGLWIEMTGAATLSVGGTRPASTVSRLCRGWNLVGYPLAMAMPVQGALSSIEGRYDRVFGWDPTDTDDPWDFYAVGAPAWANYLRLMRSGQGYWMHATEEVALVLTPPQIPPEMQVPGCINRPIVGDTVSGQVDIVLRESVSLQSATVDYWPAHDLEAAEVLTTGLDVTGGETVATLDTTLLANGSYVIRVSGADENGDLTACGVMVTVEGEYKPGRVRFTVMDMNVPVAGLPIYVGRTYDSLERAQEGDFGYGWSLAIGNPKLEVDPEHNVTMTMPDGRRVTFYYHPHFIWGFGIPRYIPEPGVYGSLTPKACGLVVLSGGQYFCFPGGPYQESVSGYVYTDPYGREFDIDIDGTLNTIKDLNDNILTFSADGITSSVGGLEVTFTRDVEERITTIIDPTGNVYGYEYDVAGDLVAVHLPGMDDPVRYTYNADHFFLSAVDPRGNTIIEDTYYPDGRLMSETDSLGNTTLYAYDLDTRATVMTNPDGGIVTKLHDQHGNLVSRTDPLSRTTTFAYDDNHNMLSYTDPLDHTTSYTYDSNGNQTSIIDPLGNTRYATFNRYGGPTSEVDALGNEQTIFYDAYFRPISISDALGTRASYTWDDQGSILTSTDGNGETTSLTYDQYGNLVSQEDAGGLTTTFAYDLLGRLVGMSNPLSDTIQYTYDALGHITVFTQPLGVVNRYEYDANGNGTKVTDAAGHETTFVYDAANRPVQINFPDGTSKHYTYDWRGNLLTETDQAGQVTGYGYDLAGKLVRITYADGTSDAATIYYAYDAAGRRIGETDSLGHMTAYAYDAADRMIRITDPLSRTTIFAYDADGRRTSVTDAIGHQTGYSYDARGQLIEVTYPDGTTMQQRYDGVGNVLGIVDQAGKVTTYTYNHLGRLLSVTNSLSQTTTYRYDGAGNLVSVTDANDHRISFEYDALSRQTRKTWPDGSFEVLTYDVGDNLTSHQAADGQVNQFGYDELGRLMQIDYFDGRVVTYSYTPTGLPHTVIDGRGTTTYAYDDRGRLTQINRPDGQTVAYTYDSTGNRLSLTTVAGTVAYGYDQANQLTSVTDPLGQSVAYTYDDAGRCTQLSYPNGITVDYGYDSLNRVVDIVQRNESSILASYHYSLGLAGNRLSVVEVDGSSVEWGYDDAYRLTEETWFDSSSSPITQTNYIYDAVGNRLSMAVSGQTTTYQYNELDQLISVGAVQYDYDGRGNLVRVTRGADITTYTYDAADRLIGVTLPDSTSVSYGYDAEGRRVRQTVGVQVINYVWDEASAYGDVVLETDASGTILTSYVLGDEELLWHDQGGVRRYYLQDGQGNARHLADADGNIVDRYTYDAFGALLQRQGTTANPYLYTGQQFDALTRLYSLRARYYDPANGRFLSRDTAGMDLQDASEHNRYVYVANNPINAFDPSGRQATIEYGQGTSDRGTHTAKATGPTRNAVMQSKELGHQYATNSRNMLYRLEDNLASQYGPTRARHMMKSVNIAESQIQGQSIITVNGGAQSEAVAALRQMGVNVRVAPGNMHAERYIYEIARRTASMKNLPIDSVIKAIGSARVPCQTAGHVCMAIGKELPLFWFGKLLPFLAV